MDLNSINDRNSLHFFVGARVCVCVLGERDCWVCVCVSKTINNGVA